MLDFILLLFSFLSLLAVFGNMCTCVCVRGCVACSLFTEADHVSVKRLTRAFIYESKSKKNLCHFSHTNVINEIQIQYLIIETCRHKFDGKNT